MNKHNLLAYTLISTCMPLFSHPLRNINTNLNNALSHALTVYHHPQLPTLLTHKAALDFAQKKEERLSCNTQERRACQTLYLGEGIKFATGLLAISLHPTIACICFGGALCLTPLIAQEHRRLKAEYKTLTAQTFSGDNVNISLACLHENLEWLKNQPNTVWAKLAHDEHPAHTELKNLESLLYSLDGDMAYPPFLKATEDIDRLVKIIKYHAHKSAGIPLPSKAE